MTNRRDFLKGLLSSIGGIMIVKPPSIDDVIKEPEKPKNQKNQSHRNPHDKHFLAVVPAP
jgi:hypothetical protein